MYDVFQDVIPIRRPFHAVFRTRSGGNAPCRASKRRLRTTVGSERRCGIAMVVGTRRVGERNCACNDDDLRPIDGPCHNNSHSPCLRIFHRAISRHLSADVAHVCRRHRRGLVTPSKVNHAVVVVSRGAITAPVRVISVTRVRARSAVFRISNIITAHHPSADRRGKFILFIRFLPFNLSPPRYTVDRGVSGLRCESEQYVMC